MKISSGIYKGRNLVAPKSGIKPTTEMIRQAVINIVRPNLLSARFLDLYAGTGAVGIEALSNGAGYALFIENAGRTYQKLKENLFTIVNDPTLYRTLRHNALEAAALIEDKANFDIIFADPYYKDSKYHFDRLYEAYWPLLNPNGLFILEHGGGFKLEHYPGHVEDRKYGDTYLSVFRKEAK